ncbi:hypothetical protein BPTFM16_02763 [Altererythrobacter insulae]|nr:hypothetical protein BPTFM16_02763 [Altererythrobacter insulae]
MQNLGRRYVQYYNYHHNRTGTLWEGRYKSCLIQEELYLLQVYKYIELNPIRAGMVTEPSEYHWSSYHINALGKHSSLCTPHTEYLNLGATDLQRQHNYRAIFKTNINEKLTAEIRLSLCR